MHKVIIIDDNPMLRRSLAETVDWASVDCEVVGMAENGPDGWEMCKAVLPDITISDIKMPGFTGIDLIEKIADSGLDTQVIFITGFQEFEYAQKAVRYGAADFLLKPIKNEDLLCAIKKALTKRAPSTYEALGQDVVAEMRTLALQICLTVERNVNEDGAVHETARIINEINACQSILSITEYVDSALKRLKQHVVKDEVSPLTKSILEHIATLYHEDISLSQTAQKFFLNPSYLSRLLKKETNMNFTDIVAQARIDRAKTLLQDASLKIIDIAQMAGFSDYTYFSQVFKKMEGISPTEYRKRSSY